MGTDDGDAQAREAAALLDKAVETAVREEA